MALYENIILLSENISEKIANDKIKEIEDIIKEGKGNILKKEYWGLRTLAYKIKKNSKAHYFLLNTENDYSLINKIKNKLKIDENHIRFLNLRIDEIDKEPSVILKNDSKNERYK